jgi:hypothetical protein
VALLAVDGRLPADRGQDGDAAAQQRPEPEHQPGGGQGEPKGEGERPDGGGGQDPQVLVVQLAAGARVGGGDAGQAAQPVPQRLGQPGLVAEQVQAGEAGTGAQQQEPDRKLGVSSRTSVALAMMGPDGPDAIGA